MYSKVVESSSRDNLVSVGRGAKDKRPYCLACGASITTGEPTIKLRGALVHLRCAVYRRRLARRLTAVR